MTNARTDALNRILAERYRQSSAEGFSPTHDCREHVRGELVRAAACYVAQAATDAQDHHWVWNGKPEATDDPQPPPVEVTIAGKDAWPFDASWDKREKHDTIRCLEIAGALILAELERQLTYARCMEQGMTCEGCKNGRGAADGTLSTLHKEK